jgi:hypothetical protein
MARASLLTSSRASGNAAVYRASISNKEPKSCGTRCRASNPTGAQPQRGRRCSRRSASLMRRAMAPKTITKSDHVKTSSGRSSMRSTRRARLLSTVAPFGPIPVRETAAISTADIEGRSNDTARMKYRINYRKSRYFIWKAFLQCYLARRRLSVGRQFPALSIERD